MLTANQTSLFLQTFVYLSSLQSIPDTPNTPQLEADAGREVRNVQGVNSTKQLTTCYGIYGCFYLGYPWTKARPVNLFPLSPEVMNPTFCLHTLKNPTMCQVLRFNDVDTVGNSYLMPEKKLFIISHGYLENGNEKWIKHMVKEFLQGGDVNVLVLDWVGGSGPPYTQAVANIRMIGTMVAHFIAYLKESFGVDPEFCHIVGHSLAAHLAGYTGQRLQELGYRLGRITGLDPAEPHFANSDNIVRLDPTDALFVDVIHTDGDSIITGGLGLAQPLGHVDFYPNGGMHQPGCGNGVLDYIKKEDGSLVHGLRRFLGCNHIRSYEFFTESINSKCPFLGVQCESWKQFQTGGCADCGEDGSSCAKMGLHADEWAAAMFKSENSSVKMFLLTGSSKPFCKYHYQVTIKMSDTNQSIRHGGDIGYFHIKLQGETNSSIQLNLHEEEIYFEPRSVHTFMVSGEAVGRLRSAEVQWQYSGSLFNPLTWRLFETPLVYVRSISVMCVETQQRDEFCGYNLGFISEKPQVLFPQKQCYQPIDQTAVSSSFLNTILNINSTQTLQKGESHQKDVYQKR